MRMTDKPIVRCPGDRDCFMLRRCAVPCRGSCNIERTSTTLWAHIRHAAAQGNEACAEVIKFAGPLAAPIRFVRKVQG